MVTAQSNSACDEVGDRLLKYVSPQKVFRFYSPSLLNTEKGETSEALRKTSNLRGKRNQYPTMEEFKHFNVVIVTLMSCSRLVQFDGIGMNRHFDYMFLDEAAAAMEPEAYVPIMGELMKSYCKLFFQKKQDYRVRRVELEARFSPRPFRNTWNFYQ